MSWGNIQYYTYHDEGGINIKGRSRVAMVFLNFNYQSKVNETALIVYWIKNHNYFIDLYKYILINSEFFFRSITYSFPLALFLHCWIWPTPPTPHIHTQIIKVGILSCTCMVTAISNFCNDFIDFMRARLTQI